MIKGKENLKSLRSRTTGEQRKICSLGGKASGEARRRAKTLREAMHVALSLPAKGQPDKSNLEAIVAKAVCQALRGDDRARQFILQTLGGVKAELQSPVVKQILRRFLSKQLSLKDTAIQIEMAGAVLPESLKIQLSNMEPEPEDPTGGAYCTFTDEELEERAAKRRAEIEEQYVSLSARQEEMAALHKQVEDSWASSTRAGQESE